MSERAKKLVELARQIVGINSSRNCNNENESINTANQNKSYFELEKKDIFQDFDSSSSRIDNDFDADDTVRDPNFTVPSLNDSVIENEIPNSEQSSDSENLVTSAEEEMILLGTQVENELLAESRKKITRQKMRNTGQSYKTISGKIINKRICKPFDKCRNNCQSKITHEACKKLFNHYWSLGTYDKRILYISSLLEIGDKKCNTLANCEVYRKRKRETTVKYSLNFNGNCINQICRKHFTQCFDETDSFIKSVIRKNMLCPSVPLTNLRGKSVPTNKINFEKLEEVQNHIKKFPAYDSHYSRRDTTKKYLHSSLNLTIMHKLCTQETEKPVSLTKYSEIFKSMNLKFKAPNLDTCSTCDSMNLKIKVSQTDEEKTNLIEMKNRHVDKADMAYEQKRIDKGAAKKNQNLKVFAFDLQQCLPTPFLRTSISFYKRQLWTFNLTIHDLENDVSQCFMWHEAAARRGGNEIASCVYKQLNMINKDINKVCFYSDSCVGQNKSSHVATMFMIYVNNSTHIEYIDHKFLEPGHTHMECDSDHALIERKKKKTNVEIQIPRDWYQFVNSVSSKMRVVEMKANDFLNFSELSKSKFVWRRHNNDAAELFVWKEVRWLRYTKGLTYILCKTSLNPDEQFKVLKIGKRGVSSISSNDIHVIRDIPTISLEKKKDLLYMKEFINPEFHSFYETLNEQNSEPDIHPDLLVEEDEDSN